MEYEVRYYYPKEDLQNLLNLLSSQSELENEGRLYEKTEQFDHPMEEMSFYSKEMDGRFRLRISKSSSKEKCKLSWKRRIQDPLNSEINKEEEVELNLKYDEYDNMKFIIDNVLKMKSIESYERHRTTFENDEVEIAVDEYPFGIALEIEAKKETENPEDIINYWTKELKLDESRRYKLSWDDKYTELCKEQNKEIYSHVLFDKDMPEVK